MKLNLLTPFDIRISTDPTDWKYVNTSIQSYALDPKLKLPDCKIFHRYTLLGFIENNTLHILPFYAFDGMSWFPDTPRNLPWALLHDFLYQTGLLSKRDSDKLLFIGMKQSSAYLPYTVFAGVTLLGFPRYNYKQKDIKISPL